ncbi:hypothetical protein MN032_09815 [Agromyces atrinae]|uniref:glycosyltransferase n=1 Tax=Agromyces atrinae TaxID=592376 RepID=UPI001F56AF8B|nr:hypothetical protein [Agromyces atrinae]MCI2957989.1 hypothetical protein [Agromyces atrinae]
MLSGLRRRASRAADRVIGGAFAVLPERWAVAVAPRRFGFTNADVPGMPPVPAGRVRLYIAPVNFAAQAYAWARAASRLDGVGAVNTQYSGPDGFAFPADLDVPVAVFANSTRWQRQHFERVSREFTHVLVEAERPIFGPLFDTDVAREVAALRARGVSVAFVSHGSDLRLPSRHRDIDRWSPFHDADPLVTTLEQQAVAHRAILANADAPVFVSTPDLLEDWPAATWLPVVVDPDRWTSDAPVLERDVPVVIHAPTSSFLKGSDLVEPALIDETESGRIDYRRIPRVPSAEMPAIVHASDILVEQFRIGTYSVAAVEALAAGRLVVAHVHDQVREHVRAATGLEVPVVEATPDTLVAVLSDIRERREHYRAIAESGPAFVRAVHDGRRSAGVLAPFLGVADESANG